MKTECATCQRLNRCGANPQRRFSKECWRPRIAFNPVLSCEAVAAIKNSMGLLQKP